MLNKDHVKEQLKAFSQYVVKQARTNLSKGRKNDTKGLYDSIKGNYKVSKNSIALWFEMNEYGQYQDKGVKGAGGVRKSTSKYKSTNNRGKLWKQNAPNSPFAFRNIKPSVKHFTSWANKKGLSPFAVREAVYHQGIKPSLFFTKAFEGAYKRFPIELQEAYGLEVTDQFFDIIKQPK